MEKCHESAQSSGTRKRRPQSSWLIFSYCDKSVSIWWLGDLGCLNAVTFVCGCDWRFWMILFRMQTVRDGCVVCRALGDSFSLFAVRELGMFLPRRGKLMGGLKGKCLTRDARNSYCVLRAWFYLLTADLVHWKVIVCGIGGTNWV